jgi:phosphate-selective porin OprO/OprP
LHSTLSTLFTLALGQLALAAPQAMTSDPATSSPATPSPAASTAAGVAAPTGPQLQDKDILWSWDGRLRWRTPDYEFSGSIGGELVFLAEFGGAPTDEDRFRFEQARLRFDGQIYQSLSYLARFDFAEDETRLRDVYVQFDELFLGANLRLGNQREPFGLEQLTDLHATTFIDRSAFSLAPGWAVGAAVHSDFGGGDGVWSLGFFGPDVGAEKTSEFEGEGNFTGRVAYALEDVAAPDDLLHIGAAASSRGTDTPGADRATLLGAELAYVSGPFSAQAEWHERIDDDGTLGGDTTSWYAQVSYFLTDDSRRYERGRFLTVDPSSRWVGFGQSGGGALEVALRLDQRDDGGPSDDERVELGLNWYLSGNASLSITGATTELDGGSTDESLGLRTVLLF